MISVRNNLTGKISNRLNLKGKLNTTIKILKPELQDKELTINENGTHTIRADEEFYGLNQVSVTVDAIEDLTNELDTYNTELTEQETSLEDIIEALKDKGIGEVPKYKPYHILFKSYTGTDLTYETSNLDTSKITFMNDMFNYCSKLTSVDVSEWDTSNAINMTSMFYYCSKLDGIDVSKWNISNVETTSNMFQSCSNLTELDVSKWNVSKVTQMQSMFNNCKKLANLDVSNWNTSSVKNMNSLFYSCQKLAELDLSKWNTEQVTDMANMFYSCTALKSINVKDWDISQVTTLSQTFRGCSTLTELDLSNWHTNTASMVTSNMFYACSSLQRIDMRNFDFTKCVTYTNMFGSSNVSTFNHSCLIIVQDDAQKEWVTSKFTFLTNVKTVAELEV